MGPDTKTIEIWADTRGMNTCRGCGRKIVWGEIVASGKKIPFDPPAVPLRTRHDEDSRRLIEILDLGENHFATCPKRADFSRK